MTRKFRALAIACVLGTSLPVFALADEIPDQSTETDPHDHERAAPAAESDAHADHDTQSDHADHADHLFTEPIGVMNAHAHEKHDFMFSYRYSRMRMDGNRDGTDRVSVSSILLPDGSYMVSPTDMDMQMHMFGAMYAPADWVTLSAMIPYVELDMDHHMANGMRFRTTSQGVGDLKLSSLFRVFERGENRFLVNLGVSFPTGGIDHEDDVPVPMQGFQKRRLPYPMQIGSGTFDLLTGATYTGGVERLKWGAQVQGTVRFGENEHDYRFGNRADVTAWLTLPVLAWLDLSARFVYGYQGDVHGADPSLNPNAVPTADPKLRKGQRIDLLAGVSLKLPLDRYGRHRFGIEVGGPPWQKLDGPQLGSKWRLIAGWQVAF